MDLRIPLIPLTRRSGKTVEIYGDDVDSALARLNKIMAFEGITKKLRAMKTGVESPCHVFRRKCKDKERFQQRFIVLDVLKKVLEERRHLPQKQQ
jgi:hypothetical protein